MMRKPGIEITYAKEIIPGKEDLLNLFSDAGWKAYTSNPDTLMKGINNSLMVYTAWVDNELAGLARIVGDGETIILIQDVLILGKYQRMGIGSTLINMIKNDYKDVRQIILLTDISEKTHSFYTAAGFKVVDTAGCRAYMMIKGEQNVS